MNKILVYFHGYGSNSNTEKVSKLRCSGFDTYSWDIDIDPSISLVHLRHQIEFMFMDYMDCDVEFIFIGTSLGAWYAANLAAEYDVKAVIINPSYKPQESLSKYGLSEEITKRYYDICMKNVDAVFIGTEDTVINYDNLILEPYTKLIKVQGDHRFLESFDDVIEYIKKL